MGREREREKHYDKHENMMVKIIGSVCQVHKISYIILRIIYIFESGFLFALHVHVGGVFVQYD